jgi:hypothetical protein
VTADNSGAVIDRNFSATAVGDIDGDGKTAAFAAERSQKPIMVTSNKVY